MTSRRKWDSHGERSQARAFGANGTPIRVVKVDTRSEEEENKLPYASKASGCERGVLSAARDYPDPIVRKFRIPTGSKKRKLFWLSGGVRTRCCPASRCRPSWQGTSTRGAGDEKFSPDGKSDGIDVWKGGERFQRLTLLYIIVHAVAVC